ncbi:MAG: Mur ligase domain-containing protein, partial [Actinomycetota bacterium]
MDLAGILPIVGGRLRDGTDAAHVRIADLAYDSRAVSPGSLFFCIRGGRDDGHRHAAEAAAAGAVALVCERPLSVGLPQVVVDDARAAMNAGAAPFYGHPSRELALVGVTGTNGKTTTAYMLDSVFRA